MNQPPDSPQEHDLPTLSPEDAVDLGAAPPFDPEATPEQLPRPEQQYSEAIAQYLQQASRACAFGRYDEARTALQTALSVRLHADAVLSQEHADALPAADSLLAVLASLSIFERIDAARSAAILNLAEGWPLWAESGASTSTLVNALPDLERLTAAVSGWPEALRYRRDAFYRDLREKRPATYGHPLLDPPRLRD